VGVGANLGARWAALGETVAAAVAVGRDVRVSSVYETAPVGGPLDQEPYLNCVVVFETELSPPALLDWAHEREARAGRVRVERWGPRTLDVDIVWIDGYVSDDPVLTVPHPRFRERAFVLAPLAEVAPDLVDPDWPAGCGGPEAVAAAVRIVGELVIAGAP
jgi:2-amino-4-hydroxy-6-hydroxymethyldihydropteridine diphosphokinase